MNRKPEHLLDLRGAISPVTLLKVIERFRTVKPGESLEILGSDPATRSEIRQVLQGFALERMDIEDQGDAYRIHLTKGREGPGRRADP